MKRIWDKLWPCIDSQLNSIDILAQTESFVNHLLTHWGRVYINVTVNYNMIGLDKTMLCLFMYVFVYWWWFLIFTLTDV